MLIVSKTFDVVTPESAALGDSEDHGFSYEDQRMSVRDLIREIRTEGITEPSSSHLHVGLWLSSADPERDYSDGSETTYSLHFRWEPTREHPQGRELSIHQLRRLLKAAGITVQG